MKLFLLFILIFTTQVSAQVRYGDRFYYSNVLSSIYGDSIQEILQDNIINKPEFFGGACSYMEEIFIKDKKGNPEPVENVFRCNSLAESKIKPFAVMSIFKKSQISKICTLISTNDSIILNSMEGYYLYEDKYLTENILRKYYPFLDSYTDFVNELLSEYEAQSLVANVEKNTEGYFFDFSHLDRILGYNNRLNKFKDIHYALCISEGWQIL